MKVTQIFNQEQKKLEEFKQKNNALRKSSLKEIFVFSIFRPSIYLLFIASRMLVLIIGLLSTLNADIIYKFYAYVDSFFNPIQNLADQFNQLQSAFASCEKIFDMDLPMVSILLNDIVLTSYLENIFLSSFSSK